MKRQLQKAHKGERYIIGMQLLENEMQKHKLPFNWLLRLNVLQNEMIKHFDVFSFEILIQKIGSGEIGVDVVLQKYRDILHSPPSYIVSLLQFFHLLPKSRVLNKEAKIIDIQIEAVDRPGMIYDISRCFVERKINIAKFGVFALPPHDALYKIRLEAEDFQSFSDLFDAILQVPTVKKVIRVK